MKRTGTILALVSVAAVVSATGAANTASAPVDVGKLAANVSSLEKRVKKLEKLLACEKVRYAVQYGDAVDGTHGYLYQSGTDAPFKTTAVDFVADPANLDNPDAALALLYRAKGCK